jgi:thioredoxin-dependent peroxiredoxin
MAQTKLGDTTVNTNGNLPPLGSIASDFTLTALDLRDESLNKYAGKNVILNIFPSIDTGICANSVREFNKRASNVKDTVVLAVSKDLPFALKRFCAGEGIDKVIALSDFRNRGFAKNYGIEMIDGAMAGFFARAIVVIAKDGKVKYTELVPAIGQEPNYDAALASIN